MAEQRSRYSTLKTLLILLFVFNLTDATTTAIMVSQDLAIELNPLMDYLLDIHPLCFVAVKLLIGTILVVYMWLSRKVDYKKVLIAAWICAVLYTLLFFYQVIAISIFLIIMFLM